MPFMQYATQNNSLPLELNIPLIVLPGIIGNAKSMQYVLSTLHEKNPKRSIIVYDNDNHAPTNIDGMLIELNVLLPDPTTPIFLVGYSYGCYEVMKLAMKLSESNRISLVYLIDGVSPKSAKTYFSQPSLALSKDLLNIVKAAVLESTSQNQTFPNIELENIMQLSFDKQIDYLVSVIQTNECNTLQKLIDKVKKNLQMLIEDTPTIIASPYIQINALMTQQTQEKYPSIIEDWQAYSENEIELESNLNLLTCDHLRLLDNNAAALAQSIDDFYEQGVAYTLHQTAQNCLAKVLEIAAGSLCPKTQKIMVKAMYSQVKMLLSLVTREPSPEPLQTPSSSAAYGLFANQQLANNNQNKPKNETGRNKLRSSVG